MNAHAEPLRLLERADGVALLRLNRPRRHNSLVPELLEALAQDFKANNFSVHHVIKTIMKSNAYQLSTVFDGEWKDAYISYHARRFARILTGPEAADMVAQATDTVYAMKQYGRSSPTASKASRTRSRS